MKRAVCLLIILMICVSLVLPAYAAEDDFVPSIAYKPEPEIVPVEDENGEERIGVIKDETGEINGYVDGGCLDMTAIAHVWDEEEVPTAAEELLLSVYDALNNGSMELPYDKFGEAVKGANMVIRDLLDARFCCEECPKLLEPEGGILELTFDLGVVADAEIVVMTYDEESKQWNPIVKAVNNGDGTVTCTFEHLCAIAFSVKMPGTSDPVADAPGFNVLPWIVLLLVAALIIVGIIFFKNKKKKAAI